MNYTFVQEPQGMRAVKLQVTQDPWNEADDFKVRYRRAGE